MSRSKITDYQRKMWQILTYFTVCRYYITRDDTDNPSGTTFRIKKAGKLRVLLYYSVWVNSIIKVSYLFLAYHRILPVQVHFLDQMGIWDWWLCFSQLVQETNMWYRKYPIYEVLSANWEVQEEVYKKLGCPRNVEEAILKHDKSVVRMHFLIVLAGAGSIWVQFFTFPKYAAYVYAVVPWDNWVLRILFCTHEMFYVTHVWVHQAWSIVLCEVYANSYTHIINEMTKTLRKLIRMGTVRPANKQQIDDNNSTSLKKTSLRHHLNPTTKATGTDYDITSLLQDYQRVTLATNAFNNWCGLLMGGTMGSNYSQFVSDVFMMIQLLKEPQTDMLGVFFYGEDALVGMWMLFRMLIIISRLYPASEEFLHTLKVYSSFDTPMRGYLVRYRRGMRVVCTKLGGYKTKSVTVPNGVNVLMNWYIAAAMWHRPLDRRT